MSTPQQPLTYRDAGVDIDAGNTVVERIKPLVKRTFRPEVMGGLGGFGALFNLSGKYREPVLVSGTDGVGTKLKLAQQLNRHDTIGIDLVGMCVNDVLVQGAESLFFLDYFATGKLDVETTVSVVGGIARGCELAGCALIGGETAEMPDMYPPGEYDLAGFCVAVAEQSKLIDGSKIKAGDVMIALPSSGPHSNGYSLVRKILAVSKAKLDQPFGKSTLAETLLTPTHIYVKPVLKLLEQGIAVRGMSHITGGGIPGNLPRCFPKGVAAVIDRASWNQPEIFDWLQRHGKVAQDEMYRVFNCGIGFVLIVPRLQADKAMASLKKSGTKPWYLGEIVKGKQDVRFA